MNRSRHYEATFGGSRFAYNAMLGLVKDNWDENRAKKESGIEVAKDDWVSTSHFGPLYLWAEHRDELAPWWTENGSSTYNDAAQRLSKAFTNFRKGRAKFPRFKHKGQGGSVRWRGSSGPGYWTSSTAWTVSHRDADLDAARRRAERGSVVSRRT